MNILFKNIKLVTPFEVLTGYCVEVRQRIISKIDKEDNILKDTVDEIVDGKDCIFPGCYFSTNFSKYAKNNYLCYNIYIIK